MDLKNLVGTFAAVLTTIAFLPQVWQVVKTKSTKDISLFMFIIYVTGVACWFLYGITLNSIQMIVSNFIVLILALIILGYKIKYK